jgi:DNA mismatch repair protein MutS
LPKNTTPMMAQYKSLKAQYKDALLFFRLGDFYEMFFEDAEIGSKELGIALTGRDAGKGKRAPMCGVPYHSVDDYIKTLVTKGYKVAICEQVESSASAKGLVRRDVVRVITPGTYWEGAENTSSSYVTVIYPQHGSRGQIDSVGLCSCDLSTGEILLCSFDEDPDDKNGNLIQSRLIDELSRLLPKECVFPVGFKGTSLFQAILKNLPGVFTSFLEDETFQKDNYSTVLSRWKLEEISRAAHKAISGLLVYIESTQMVELSHLKKPNLYLKDTFLELDHSTRRNLELTERLHGGVYGSLTWVLDQCCTSMGSRLLNQWIERPLREPQMIQERLSAVDEIYSSSLLRSNLRNSLSGIRDLERLVTKIAYKTCNARDLTAIASSLEKVPSLKKEMSGVSSQLLRKILGNLDEVPEATNAIRQRIVDDPPVSVMEGGLIRPGYSQEVDDLRDLSTGGKKWLMELEARERERTGIRSLRVGYNRVFGYYLEVTRANLSLVPDNYIRKQTLVSAERFITPELKEKETSILGAEERLFKEEYRLFSELRDLVESHIRKIQQTAVAVAQIDVLCSLSEVASLYGYVKPEISENGPIIIKKGRHPVLERVLPPGNFVPNDLVLDDKESLLIITGPNMGGKSTYCRQAALIVLMAQMGSFVPCKSCSVSCVDKIFARVGAYDDLVLGQSTFMVEMNEVSRILRNATPKSLVILDEIGRGTSTFDGLSVAWAVVEYLANENAVGAKGLVATHYRELTLLSDLKPGIANYHVTVKKSGDDIVFLRKVTKGVAEGSFGIDVAYMAGLPFEVVSRAREILHGLETETRKGSGSRKGILGSVASRSTGSLAVSGISGQPLLFGFSSPEQQESFPEEYKEVISEVQALDINHTTPLQALEILYSFKQKLNEKEHGK